jgi:hypothetical protein
MRIQILLFSELRKENPDFVRDIADTLVVCGLAPFRELGCDGDALFACGFVGLDEVVFRFD